MTNNLFEKIIASIVEGDTDTTVALVKEGLRSGAEPLALIDRGLIPGIRTVGEKFSCGEYFLPHLIMSAAGMKRVMEILEPELRARQQAIQSAGTVVIGTVKGDIHEIGKSLVATMLAANGFEVHDLGVDVPVDRFVEAVKSFKANLVGMSALLTTTMAMQKKVIEALRQAGLRSSVKVMVGGAPVTRKWAQDIGADAYAEDAAAAVEIARQLMQGAA